MPEKVAAEAQTTELKKRDLSLLAREQFGHDYHGEVFEPTPDGEQPDGDRGGEGEGEGESGEQPLDQGAAGDQEGEVEGDTAGDQGGEGEVEGEDTISSFSELIEHFELDPDWAQGLKVAIKVDGNQTETTLKDLVDNYQMGVAADKRLEDAKAKAKSLTTEVEQTRQAAQEQFAAAVKLIEHAEQLVQKDSDRIDWDALRKDDPAEYSAKKAELQERRSQIEQMKQTARDEWNQWIANQQPSREKLSEILNKERSALLEKLPEWKDQKVAEQEKGKLVKYLKDLGYSEHDIMAASDHRLIVVARKAMLFDEGKGKVQAAKKRVRKVPKVVKPGTSKPESQVNQKRVNDARARLRESGSLEDAFGVLRAQRGGRS